MAKTCGSNGFWGCFIKCKCFNKRTSILIHTSFHDGNETSIERKHFDAAGTVCLQSLWNQLMDGNGVEQKTNKNIE